MCNKKPPATQAEGLHEGSKCDHKVDRPCKISIAYEFIKHVKLLYHICTGVKRQQKALRDQSKGQKDEKTKHMCEQ